MDKNSDLYNNYYGMPPFNSMGVNMGGSMGYDIGVDPSSINASMNMNNTGIPNGMDGNAMFNPFIQYEQAYMYYRYLSMQMEYKIKCKEYDKLTSKPENSRESGRKIE